MWSPDGSELFFLSVAQQMMLARVRPGTDFAHDPPEVVFEQPNPSTLMSRFFDITPDGEQFLMIRPDEGGTRPQVIVVQNWADELTRVVPVN